jgi:adenylate cyclase
MSLKAPVSTQRASGGGTIFGASGGATYAGAGGATAGGAGETHAKTPASRAIGVRVETERIAEHGRPTTHHVDALRKAGVAYHPAMSHPARGLLSYRLSLVVAIPLLVVVTGAILTANAYFTTRASISRLAQSIFAEVAGQTAEQARAHVRQAAPAVDLLATSLADGATLPPSDEIAQRVLAVLRANAAFEWVTFNQPDGSTVGAGRRPSGLFLQTEHIVAGRSIMDERSILADGSTALVRHSDDHHYDPRLRPFYQRAVAEKRRVWIGPYIFFDEGVPGITCAEPVYAKDGSLRGVVTVDFDLNILSEFVATLHTSEHSRVFVYTDDGALLAHPTIHIVVPGANGAEGALVTKNDVPDIATRAYFANLALGTSGEARAVFESEGVRYYFATRKLEVEDGLSWNVGAIAPESDFLGDLNRTARFSVLVSLGAVAIAMLLGAALAGRVAAPLARLATLMEDVGRFELDGPEPPPSMFTEIASMNRALSAMKGGLQSFASYVPRDLVRAVLASGQTAELGGSTKTMSVFFSDLAGFTSFSETMTPAELVELLGRYFDEMTKVIASRGGTIDKFIGDAIMAFWNAPNDEPLHAVRSCEAALACARRLDELKATEPGFARLSARIGIATGDVLVGNIGSHERMNYTVMGDTANLASRLEGLGKVYGTTILVSESTRVAAKDTIVMRAIDVVAVKGKAKGVKVYEPIALRDEHDANAEKRSALSIEALDAYLAQRFDEAAAAYDRILEIVPRDVATLAMRDRCRALASHPPGDGWTGVAVMKEK